MNGLMKTAPLFEREGGQTKVPESVATDQVGKRCGTDDLDEKIRT